MPKPKKTFRSPCPVACALDIFGDRWTLLIVRDLLLGRSHYGEFAASPESIATNILADRLQRLLQHEIVEKIPSTMRPGKEAYQLTDKGRALGPVLKAMVEWGTEHVEGTSARLAKG